MSDPALEREIVAVGRTIASGEGTEHPGVFRMGWWSERMLGWAMEHPTFKTQLFRFVDVFPACRTDEDVLRHVDEYFGDVEIPRALDLGIDVAEHVPRGAWITSAVARRNIRRMARQFIAGATPADAVKRLRSYWDRGEAATVDLLGEKTVTAAEADRYAARVLELLDALVRGTSPWPEQPLLERDPWGPVPRANVSVKPSALSPWFGPLTGEEGLDDALGRLRPVLDRARADGATVHLDSEHDEAKDLTFELLRRIGAEYPDGPQLGCVVQAYRRDSFSDLEGLVAWSSAALAGPLQVRLVKGAYWDQETIVAGAEGWPSPVWDRKAESDANFERCTRFLLDHAGEARPAIASHNVRSLAHAIAYSRSLGLDDGAFEIQLLHGMAEPLHHAVTQMGLRVRVYAPVGELVPGMAYLVRRLLENTSNESFVRLHFAEGHELDELLAPPDAALDSGPVEREATISPTNEPRRELRRAPVQARALEAVDGAARTLGFDAPVVIGGRAVDTDRTLVSVDPGETSTVVCRSGCAGTAEADLAVATARDVFGAWATTSWDERADVLVRTAAIMRDRRDELAALEVFEAGKPIPEADADVCEAIDFCEYYARHGRRMAGGAPVADAPGETNAHRYQARGVHVVIAPWNFPLAIPTGMVTAALVTGNPVVFKPAEQTPGVGARLVEILLAAGCPPGAIAFLPGVGEEVGAHLVAHPDIAGIAFTGSKAVGLQILESAARVQPGQRHVKRVVAEMGGKNPIVVDTDADLDVAVPAVVQSAFGYAGQKCSAASRLIGIGDRFDEMVERVAGATRTLFVGHARELRTTCGPVIDEDAWNRVRSYQQVAADEGSVVVERADVPDGGWYVGPTVVVVDRPDARVATEEIFGPVLACVRADDFDHALAIANSSDYALAAGVFSRSPARIKRAGAELRAGNVYVNRGITGALVGRQPFGGFGLSGAGTKAGGADYLLQFVDPRVVTENTMRQGFAPGE
jgi:RHH-type transcriptional regulator, proline utilization regulon repressor / proline dehydrogenase / delta 1-pyrroline-5-carboxylate dehydrogenase